ncbi:MAG TPA: hypothetical protein PKY78_05850 [Candidatus Omnitrophota bacterium]|nr:hypothetical protein [Candidatus Omnitrophota bacterium]
MKGNNIIKTMMISMLALTLTCLGGEVYAQGGPGGPGGHGGRGGNHDRPHGDPHRGPDPFFSPHYVPHGKYFYTLPPGYVRFIFSGIEYFYWEGMYYKMMQDRYVVVSAPVGAVVTAIPVGCQPVIVNGMTYYTVNEVTYVQTTGGYKVVPAPEVVIVDKAQLRAQAAAEVKAEAQAQVAAQTAAQAQAVAPAVTTAATTTTVASAVNTVQTQKAASDTSVQSSFTVNVPNSKGSYTAVEIKKSGKGYVGPQGEYYAEFPSVEQLKAMYAK